MKKIKVVNFSALSYSGTTWLNLLLGSHPEVFALGPPHRAWSLRKENFKGACLVHGQECEFWNGFADQWNQEDNFFLALSEYSGKTIFLMDNAPPDFIKATMIHSDIEILTGRYLRDARAITASYARKMAHNKGITYTESIQPNNWFYSSFMGLPDLCELENSGSLIVHYEDAVADQMAFLNKAGDFLNIEYSQESLKFWESEHHISVGNQGPIAMIKLHQLGHLDEFESKVLYENQLELLKQNPARAFNDERWKKQLTKQERFEFDRLMGRKNAQLGYPRDIFNDKGQNVNLDGLTRLPSQILIKIRYSRIIKNLLVFLKAKIR